MTVGVILVSYNTGDVLLDSLESLLAAARFPGAPDLRVLVVDNASPDDTLTRLTGWADGARPWTPSDDMPFEPRTPRGPVTLDLRDLGRDGRHATLGTASNDVVGYLQAGANDGFAAGVNHGLETFRAMEDVDYFWILNSDAMSEPQTPARLVAAARAAEAGAGFGILGGRCYYADPPRQIQWDGGGKVDRWTGRMLPVALGVQDSAAGLPGPADGTLDYIAGCHMFVGRTYLDRVGLMPEGYFLYFEEVDWCMRRGDLSLSWVEDAAIHHRAGGSIGSQTLQSGPSVVAAYWMFRNRVRFVRRWNPAGLPTSIAYSLAKIVQLRRQGHTAAARAAWRGLRQGKAQ